MAISPRSFATLHSRSHRGKSWAWSDRVVPGRALSPSQMFEAWSAHARGPLERRRRSVLESLASVSLPADDAFLQRYPSQISVGQAQRVLIAMAVLHRPSLLIADEPTSALDVITQSEILDLFSSLNRKLGMSILYISHDLLSVSSLCNRIAILNEGEIVECATPQEIFFSPSHPFTKRLVAALPSPPQIIEKPRGAYAL